MKPKLLIINQGKGGPDNEERTGFAALTKKNHDQGPHASPVQMENATKFFIKWLRQGQSPLRGFLQIVGAGGVFYSAATAEKVARAWVQETKISDDDAFACVLARSSTSSSSSNDPAPDDAKGLFD